MRFFNFCFSFLFFVNSCGNKTPAEDPVSNVVQETVEEEQEEEQEEKIRNGLYIVKTDDHLPRCTERLENKVYYIEDEKVIKICWYDKEARGFIYKVLTGSGNQGEQGPQGEVGKNWPQRESENVLPAPTFSVTPSGLDLILTIDQFEVSQTFYTSDGTTPTINSELYGPEGITVECCDSVTYKAFRADWFFHSSDVTTYDLNFLYIFDHKFGSRGDGDGEFLYPTGILAGENSIYVLDDNRDDIQKFDLDGNFISKFGSYGREDGQFEGLRGGAVDSEDKLYVLDSSRRDVQIFNSTGEEVISQFGSQGSGNGQFQEPQGIAIDSNDNIYVVDISRCDVQKFNSSGIFVSKFGSCGEEDGKFKNIRGITIDRNNIYVLDGDRYDVQKISPINP